MWNLIAQVAEKKIEQGEYGLAWALIAGMIFLGVLIISVPRPRKYDVIENERKRIREGLPPSGKSVFGKKVEAKAKVAGSFGAAIAQRREQK